MQTDDLLESIARELQDLRLKSDDADRTLLITDPSSDLPAGLRNELCQLHGSANKIIATRLDAILTGELTSGKDLARAKRKQLIFQAEELIEKVEAQVKQVDARKGDCTKVQSRAA